jgi:hypothetical protein
MASEPDEGRDSFTVLSLVFAGQVSVFDARQHSIARARGVEC